MYNPYCYLLLILMNPVQNYHLFLLLCLEWWMDGLNRSRGCVILTPLPCCALCVQAVSHMHRCHLSSRWGSEVGILPGLTDLRCSCQVRERKRKRERKLAQGTFKMKYFYWLQCGFVLKTKPKIVLHRLFTGFSKQDMHFMHHFSIASVLYWVSHGVGFGLH